MDLVKLACRTGFACQCQCFNDNDCQQNHMDLGCNTCTNKDALSGFGTCASTTKTIVPRPAPSPTCNYPTTPNTHQNTALSTNLNVIVVLDTTGLDAWSTTGAQFASAFINNLTVATGFAKIGLIRAGTVTNAHSLLKATALVNLTSNNNGTLNRVLSMYPTPAAVATAAIDPFVDAMQLASSMFEPGRRSVLIVVSNAMPVNACADQDPVSLARTLSLKKGIDIISVAMGSQVSDTQAMIGTTNKSSVAIGSTPTSASEYVIAYLLGNQKQHGEMPTSLSSSGSSSLCGRRCSGALHCVSSTSCQLCNGDGTCGSGSCALPIPSTPMNTNVSSQLEMVMVLDVGSPATVAESLRAAGTIGLNFTNAKIAVIKYASEDSAINTSAFPVSTQALSALTCSAKCQSVGTGGLAKALDQAGVLLNQSLTKTIDNATGAPLQVVVIVSSQVKASLIPYFLGGGPPQPVVSARNLWSDGVQVFSLIADQLCSYGKQGYSEQFECKDANMLGAVDSSVHTIDLRTTTVDIAASVVSEAILNVHRTPPTCTWKEFTHRRVALAFRSFHVDSQGTCVEKCCRHRRCKATTVVPFKGSGGGGGGGGGGGVLCRFHDRWQIPFTLPSPASSLFRKEDKAGCDRYCLTHTHCQFHGCGKCNFLFNKCDAGYKCGCSCTENNDCNNGEMDLSCSLCVDKDQSGYGRCRSKYCGQKCTKDSDCADAQSCNHCSTTSHTCTPKIVPDPIPGNCVLPFPGHPHKNCSTKLDLLLLLDGSASIGASAWKKILHFTAGIGLNFTTGEKFMNYGVVEFSTFATTFLPLTNSNASFQHVVATLPYMDGSTNTESGFLAIEKEFNAHSRVGAFKVMIILTDGEWNEGGDPGPISKRLKANQTKIFTVAVGEAATKKVAALASLPLSKYYYNVTNEQFLPKILHRMILGLCNREEHDVDIKDELIASEKWTKQVMVPMKTLQPMQPMKTLQTSSRRRLDWSNISASEIFDCGGNGPSRWIIVDNGALNPLRIRTCDVDYNKQVCKGTPTQNQTGYTQCAPNGNSLAFIPSSSTVAMRVPLNVTYVVALYCVNNPGRSIHCLNTPTPLEWYGPNPEGGAFPVNGLVVPKETSAFCSVDVDCKVGEACDANSHTCG